MSDKKPDKTKLKISKKKSSFIIVSMAGIAIVAIMISSLSLSTKSAVAKVCGESANHINYGLCLKEKTLEECKKGKSVITKNPVFDNVDRVIIAVDNYSNNEKVQALLPDILKHQSLEKLLKEKYERRYKELPEDTEPSNRKNCYNRNGQSVTVYSYKTPRQKEKFHKKAQKAGTLAVIMKFRTTQIRDEFQRTTDTIASFSVNNLRSDVTQDYLKLGLPLVMSISTPKERLERHINTNIGATIR